MLNLKGKRVGADQRHGHPRVQARRVRASPADLEEGSLGAKVIASMCELVDHDRRMGDRFDSNLLKESITMLHVLNVYGKSFEPRFLADSHGFFEDFAKERSDNYGLKDYINSCDKLLSRRSSGRTRTTSIARPRGELLDDAHCVLVENLLQASP